MYMHQSERSQFVCRLQGVGVGIIGVVEMNYLRQTHKKDFPRMIDISTL